MAPGCHRPRGHLSPRPATPPPGGAARRRGGGHDRRALSGPGPSPHPRWLAERYPSGTTAQIVRVYVRAEHRRHGLARTLVRTACDFAAATPGYDSIYLHTKAHVEGAEGFWRSIAKEIFDARTTGEHGPGVGTVHFEIPMPR